MMGSTVFAGLTCVILVFSHFGCFLFETSLDNQVKTVTWLPGIPTYGDDQAVIVTVPAVTKTFGCMYCYKYSPNTGMPHGLYVAVFNLDGALWHFDVFGTEDSSSRGEDQRFKDFLNSLPSDKVLVIALHGDVGVRDWSLIYSAVESAGGLTSSLLRNVNRREAYAFITITGQAGFTQERHVRNPYKMSYVETGYLFIEAGGLHFRVNSKVHSSRSKTNGVDFSVMNEEMAHPILQLNANVSVLRPGDRIVIISNDFDWTKAEEKVIARCPSCEINEIRLTEPLKFIHYEECTFLFATTPVVGRKDKTGSQMENIYIKGYVKDSCVYNNPDEEGFCNQCNGDTFRESTENLGVCNSVTSSRLYLNAEDEIRCNEYAPDYLYVGNCGIKGRCVFTKVKLTKESYVLFYHGRRLVEQPNFDDEYLFEILINGTAAVWIDASEEDGSYGRLMNDNHINPNLVPEIVYVDDEPNVGFFAAGDIEAGEELTFDYGGNTDYYWWRSEDVGPTEKMEQIDVNAEDET